jgi:hypothetical protein
MTPSNIPGPSLLAKDIDWSRQSPCNDCPFLRTSPYHEGVASSIPDYVQSIQDGNFAHTCHKTDNRDAVDGPKNFEGKTQHCVGAILMLLKTGKGMDLQLPLLQAAERGEIDLKVMAERAKEAKHFFTLWEMLKFYADELKKRISNPRARAELRRAKRRRSRQHGR